MALRPLLEAGTVDTEAFNQAGMLAPWWQHLRALEHACTPRPETCQQGWPEVGPCSCSGARRGLCSGTAGVMGPRVGPLWLSCLYLLSPPEQNHPQNKPTFNREHGNEHYNHIIIPARFIARGWEWGSGLCSGRTTLQTRDSQPRWQGDL